MVKYNDYNINLSITDLRAIGISSYLALEPLELRAELLALVAATCRLLYDLLRSLAVRALLFRVIQIVKLPKLASRSCLLSLRSYQLADR